MIVSDHHDNWSGELSEPINPFSPKPASRSRSPATAAAFSAPRIPDRAVQALRQTRLQVRSGARTRAQVLPVDQSTRRPTRHGLCPTRFARDCRPISRKLSFDSTDPGSNLQHQPRATASQRALIENQRVPGKIPTPHCTNRSPPRSYSDCKHGRSFFANRTVGNLSRGDQR